MTMADLKFTVFLHVALLCLIDVSCTLPNFQPTIFNDNRYRRSRAWSTSRSFDPIKDYSNNALDFMALVNQFGYPAEEHLVTTVDGYKLRLHRVPGSPSMPKAKRKPIVYFQHGIFSSSDTWILRGPNKDLAYILADAGFDVWFGNSRGNTYCREHVSLSPDHDPAFWNFSWHEIALYDVSRMIDYILAETGRQRLVYIGHSMGTTISYVLLSTKPEYNERVELVISLAPVAFWRGKFNPFLKFLYNYGKSIKNILRRAQIHELFPKSEASLQLISTSCATESILQPICVNLLKYVAGSNPKQLNNTLLPYYMSYVTSGTSTKTLFHYYQILQSGLFQMFDYGPRQNMITYNSERPPLYNVKNIIAPVALFYGKGDKLVLPGDPMNFAKQLPNIMTVEAVPDENFNHVDFIFAEDLKTLLLDRLFEIIMKVLRNQNTL